VIVVHERREPGRLISLADRSEASSARAVQGIAPLRRAGGSSVSSALPRATPGLRAGSDTVTRSPLPVFRQVPGQVHLPVRRRPVLVGLTAVLALPAVTASIAGCADKAPDPLIALVNQARSDATLIAAAAQAWQSPPAGQPERPTGPITADLLNEVAKARSEHDARMTKELGDHAPPKQPAGAAGQPAPAQDPTAALTAVLNALDAAQRSAASLVPGLSRHQAALVGSVAACCAAYRSVLL
jgi:hypothetical protein